MTKPVLSLLFCVASTVLMTSPSRAQTTSDKFWFEASAYWPHIDSDVNVASTANPNISTRIDLEDDLGLDDNAVLPAFLVGARVTGHLSVVGEYFSIGRDNTKTLGRDLIFEGVTYPANATVYSRMKTDVYRLTLNYAFVRNDVTEFGAALGLHATNFDVSINGQGNVGSVSGQSERRNQDFLAPLPTVGLFGTYRIAPKVTVGARADYLSLKVDDYKGRLINAQAKISYRFTPNFGIGLGYRHVSYRVDAYKQQFQGRFQYQFSGPALFLEAGF